MRSGSCCGSSRQLMGTFRGPDVLFDLESAEVLARPDEPIVYLRPLRGHVVIDEVQGRPALFETIRVPVDEPGAK